MFARRMATQVAWRANLAGAPSHSMVKFIVHPRILNVDSQIGIRSFITSQRVAATNAASHQVQYMSSSTTSKDEQELKQDTTAATKEDNADPKKTDKDAHEETKQSSTSDTQESSSAGNFFDELKQEFAKQLPKGTAESLGTASKTVGSVGETVGSVKEKVTEKLTKPFESDKTSWEDAFRSVFGLKPKVPPIEPGSAQDPDTVWYETKDEETGEIYYYNDSGATSWEVPVNVKQTAENEAHEWMAQHASSEPAGPSFLETQIMEFTEQITTMEAEREAALEESDMKRYKELNKEIRAVRKQIEKLTAKANSNELVVVETKKGAWEQFSEGLRGSPLLGTLYGLGDKVGASQAADKVRDAAEDAREALETSQHPLVYRMYSVWDSVFAENEMGEAIRAFRKLEPTFSLEGFLERMEEEIIPKVLGAFLRGDKATLDLYCGEAAAAATKAAISEREAAGMTMDHNILSIDNAQIAAAKVIDKVGPLIVVQFMAQQIDCMYDSKGAVAQGADDKVNAVFYAFAMEQFYDEKSRKIKWQVKEFAILGNTSWV